MRRYRLLRRSHHSQRVFEVCNPIHAQNATLCIQSCNRADFWICPLSVGESNFVWRQRWGGSGDSLPPFRVTQKSKFIPRCEMKMCHLFSFSVQFSLVPPPCGFRLHPARPDLMCCPLPLLPWSGLMCDTDQQCQSPAAVTPVSPKARQKPLILVISHPSSPLSLPPCSVTWHSGSLCPVTLLVCVCARPCTLECSRSGQPGPLSHENRSISVPLAHLFLSFSCPRLPSFNTLHYEQVLL